MLIVITLFVMGAFLIFVEIFAPGAILGIVGLCLVGASVTYGWMNYPEYGLFILMGEGLGVAAIVVLGLYLLASGKIKLPMILEGEQKPEEGWTSPGVDEALLGAEGRAHTALRPAGTIIVEEQRIDAVSSGTFIDQNSAIRIVRIEGHRVVVETAEGDG